MPFQNTGIYGIYANQVAGSLGSLRMGLGSRETKELNGELSASAVTSKEAS